MSNINDLIGKQERTSSSYAVEIEDVEPISQAEYKVDERCPVCEDNNVEGSSIDISNGQATQNINCISCGAYWTDVYKLDRYDNLHDKEGNEIEGARRMNGDEE